MPSPTQKANLDTVKALLASLDQYDSRGDKVIAISDITTAAIEQNLTPEEVVSEGQESAVEYLRALGAIAEQSRDIEDLMPDAEHQANKADELNRRWRSIRAKAIKGII
jgi:hypothetical protein